MNNIGFDLISIIGNVLFGVLGLASGVSSIILFIELIKSREYKNLRIIKNIEKNLVAFSYLRTKSDFIKPRTFLYNHKNNGTSPCNLEEPIVIDTSYLTSNSVLFLEKGGISDERHA